MKNLQILSILFIGIFTIESCMTNDLKKIQSVNFGETFTLEFEQEAEVVLDLFKIKILDVIEDSRCPNNDDSVNCFWGGQVRTEAELTIEEQAITKELIFRHGKNIPLIYGDYIIELVNVTPDNQIDEVIELKDYRFEIIITKQSIATKV